MCTECLYMYKHSTYILNECVYMYLHSTCIYTQHMLIHEHMLRITHTLNTHAAYHAHTQHMLRITHTLNTCSVSRTHSTHAPDQARRAPARSVCARSMSHHHTYYVTSSYILCHIIIHTRLVGLLLVAYVHVLDQHLQIVQYPVYDDVT